MPGPQASFTVEREGKPAETVLVEGEDQIAHMLDNLTRAVLDGCQPKPDPRDAVGTLRALDALARSAAEQREIDV